MCQQHVQPPASPVLFSASRQELSAPPAIHSESSSSRKRPLLPLDRPTLAPRAIQPRPPVSATSYSSESGASAFSPGLEDVTANVEQPRKRGRPSKAETERRKAAAEARGEVYPPPRRPGSGKLKVPSTPASPSAVGSAGTSHPPQASSLVEAPKSTMRREVLNEEATAPVGPSNSGERTRSMSDSDRGSNARQLPRPPELGQPLPSPHALQLGQRESTPRTLLAPSLFHNVPLSDDGRQALVNPISGRPDHPPVSKPEVVLGARSVER